MARARTNVSLAALRIDTDPPEANQQKITQPIKRRQSLPTTQEEIEVALRQTAEVQDRTKDNREPTLEELGKQQTRPYTSTNVKHANPRAMTAGVGRGRERYHIAKVDVSEQGLDRLSPRKR